MYHYDAWFTDPKAEPREATWTTICSYYRDLNKKVTVSQVDREEIPVILLPSYCATNASDVVSLNKGVKNLRRQSSKVDKDQEPLIFLTCYFFQTRKGILLFSCSSMYFFKLGWINKTKYKELFI
uniref:Uncharacterized protein n=1 Tax=Cacopsylla melanoneura TaxID=428564 RepID=A0A8D8SE52_9HEMI